MNRERSRSIRAVAALFAALGLAACGAPGREAPSSPAVAVAGEAATPAPVRGPLVGTRWRLLEIQSMDDTVGTTRPDDPALYTLAFGADGAVAMRLNCNRGSGSWSVELDSTGQAGSLRIGPLAVTRALCPPPSLDERIARDMDYVRGFLLRDGRLALSLMADGGIYLWEPDPAPAE